MCMFIEKKLKVGQPNLGLMGKAMRSGEDFLSEWESGAQRAHLKTERLR